MKLISLFCKVRKKARAKQKKTTLAIWSVSTEIGESDDDDHIRISVTGFMNQSGQMLQTITVIYFDTISEARKFMRSPEGKGFDDPYGQGQDNFEYTTYAGNSRLLELIVTILQNYFGFKATSQMVAPHFRQRYWKMSGCFRVQLTKEPIHTWTSHE